MLLHDGGAHLLKTLDVQIDRTPTDGASAGHGYARHASPCDQRPEHQGTGAHCFHDFVFCNGIRERAATEVDAMAFAAIGDFGFCSH